MAVIPADPRAAADTREWGHNDQPVHVQKQYSSGRLCSYQI